MLAKNFHQQADIAQRVARALDKVQGALLASSFIAAAPGSPQLILASLFAVTAGYFTILAGDNLDWTDSEALDWVEGIGEKLETALGYPPAETADPTVA